MRLLIAEDELDLARALMQIFKHDNYSVDTVADGDQALDFIRTGIYDAVILDIMMPKRNGLSVLRQIREEGNNVPVLLLTAKGEVFDRVLGLELGADDFVVKPFDLNELSARIKAVLRRYTAQSGTNDEVVKFENIEISRQKYELKLRGKPIDIPPKELELLYFLASHCNIVYTRDQLLDKVWGFEYYGDSRTVDVHVKRLREKLEGVSDKWTLKTVWGVGYKFETFQ